MIILGIDIGVKNLGLVKVEYDGVDIRVHSVSRSDITHFHCNARCTIPHTNETADRIAHFVDIYENEYNEADIILLERQPLWGMKDVESLLLYMFRDKTKLISPVSMHKHFGISAYEYDERKVKTEEIAAPYMVLHDAYWVEDRKHDMADAFCLVLFYIQTQLKSMKPKVLKASLDSFRIHMNKEGTNHNDYS